MALDWLKRIVGIGTSDSSEDLPPKSTSDTPRCQKEDVDYQKQLVVKVPFLRAGACVVKEKLWAGRQVLRVYFMNPEVLEEWKCEGKKMTTEMILEWAGAWKQAPSAPQFEFTSKVGRADIRVKFSDEGGCHSLVGMEAASIATEPTMTLNLSNKDASEVVLRYLVIHEFGHALGLEHEHQCSDFWDTVQEFMDHDRVKRDDNCFRPATTEKGECPDGRPLEYDPQSIMHYWFYVDSLKNKDHHTPEGITSDPKLSEKQKRYLLDIHTRSSNCAPNPSPKDISRLEQAYCELGCSVGPPIGLVHNITTELRVYKYGVLCIRKIVISFQKLSKHCSNHTVTTRAQHCSNHTVTTRA